MTGLSKMEMYLLAVVNLVRSATCPIYFQWGLRLVICTWCELGMHNLAEKFVTVKSDEGERENGMGHWLYMLDSCFISGYRDRTHGPTSTKPELACTLDRLDQ